MKVRSLSLEEIVIPEARARATFSDEEDAELKASIEKNGFTIPILVRKIDEHVFELVDGEHRIELLREMGQDKVPAVISELDDTRATMLNILANTARGSQNPMDVAEALKRAADTGVNTKELAAAIGHTESWVRLYLTLPEMPDHYKDALRDGVLRVGHVQEAMRLNDPVEIDAALQSVLSLHWNVKTLKYYVDERVRHISEAVAAGNKEFLENPPTTSYAKEVVAYGNCMTCHRTVNRADLTMPTICPDCRALLEWIIEQLGDPKEAMQIIYNAVSMYFEVTRQKRMEVPEKISTMQAAPENVTSPTSFGSPQGQPPAQVSEEDLKMLKIIKLIKSGVI